MKDLESYLFDVAEEIKKDFEIEADTPKFQNFSLQVFEKASSKRDFFNLMGEGLENLGFHLSSNLLIDKKKKEISVVHSPLILKEENTNKILHWFFDRNVERIESDDRKKIFSYIVLTPIYLNVKLDSLFPYFHPHLLTIPKFISLTQQYIPEIDPEVLMNFATLSTIYFAYDIQTHSFYAFYLIKKLEEMKKKYVNFLPEHFLSLKDLDVDHKNPQKYFEHLKLFLPPLRKMGLMLRGKYKETIFTKSLEEYFNYTTTPEDILWLFGIDISSKTPTL